MRASSNIVATGNVTADHFIGDGSRLSGIITSVSLGDAVNTGNITSNTVQFTNTSTSLTASGNVEVAGNVVTSGNVEAAYFIGDGSQLSGIVTSVTLGDAVNTGNITSNTVQFTNTSTSLTASGNVEVVGNVVAAYFVGDGSRLTGISGGAGGSGHWTKTDGTNELYYTAGSVGISNANPIHDLSVGSNLYVDDDATDGILKVTGNVNATYFVGDGSRLINLPAGGGSTNWTTSGDPVNKIYYPQNPGITSVSVGIMNAAPQHTLSVGSKLFIDDTTSNVLVVDGDITAESMFLGALGIKPSYPLDTVTEVGNVTPHTISFTNPTLSITTASNVEIGGALVVGKGTLGGSNLEVGEANLFVNTDLTRVGIGTNQPEATLHVNGDLSVGGVINMGIINVVAQHSLEAVTATGNTTPLTIELQNADTSLVTTGNVEVGGELNVSGNVTVSSNLTVSGNVSDLNVVSNVNMLHTSNTASIKLNSNVVAEFPRSKKLIKYPRVALNSASQDGYVVTASTDAFDNTFFHRYDPFRPFSGSANGWHSGPPHTSTVNYWDQTFDTSGYNKNLTSYGVGGYAGTSIAGIESEWLKLELPHKIVLSHFFYQQRNGEAINYAQAPKDFRILGSNDDVNWDTIKIFTGQTSYPEGQTLTAEATKGYRYLAFVVTKTHTTSPSHLTLKNLEYYGVPEYDPEAHGTDVVVKSVPNVPNTDWLEVYYDAKGLATGAVTTVNDLKPSSLGSAINSSSTNNITVADDAFVFNGTDSYIKINDLTNPLGAWVHSVVAWVKFTDFDSSCEVSWIGDADGTSIRQSFSFQPGGETVTMGISVSNVQFRFTSPLTAGKWHHVVYTYNGGQAGSTSTAYQVFIDGVEAQQFSGAGSGTLTLPADSALWIGRNHQGANHFGGSIANFRLFNRALTSDEIYQLYAYQKEYFGHGDLSMTLKAGRLGIGTSEPRAMLDVRGNFHSQNMICQTQQYEYYSGSVTVSSGSTTVLTCPFTPKYSNSKILIELSCPVQSSATYFNIFVNRGSSRITSNPGIYGIISYNSGTNLSGHFIHTGIGYDLPGTTSTINYNVVAEYGGGASIIILTGSGKLLVFIHELCQ